MHFRVEVFFLALAFTLLVSTAWSVNAMETDSGESRPEIGSQIPDLRFRDIRALPRSLSERGTHKAWVLVFTTTQCPLVTGAQTVDETFNGFVFYVADGEQLNVNIDPKSGRAK